jgi:2-dehydro-3-deoxygluconokinase
VVKRIGIIGEGMIELTGAPFSSLKQTYGGDCLNTAVYLARMSVPDARVHFVTAMGTDNFSNAMLHQWGAEGIKTDLVVRDSARLPGLYHIQVGPAGERSFSYWRSQSAARFLVQHPEFSLIEFRLFGMDLIYLSGISLAILPDRDRRTMISLLHRLRAEGKTIIFDTNFRSTLWPSVAAARATMEAVWPAVETSLVTFDDEKELWNDEAPEVTAHRFHRAGIAKVIVKCGAAGCLLSIDGNATRIPPQIVDNVVDTTAAGDAFNAAYLASRLTGSDEYESCKAGNCLAGLVIQHPGAIIPARVVSTLADILRMPTVHNKAQTNVT